MVLSRVRQFWPDSLQKGLASWGSGKVNDTAAPVHIPLASHRGWAWDLSQRNESFIQEGSFTVYLGFTPKPGAWVLSGWLNLFCFVCCGSDEPLSRKKRSIWQLLLTGHAALVYMVPMEISNRRDASFVLVVISKEISSCLKGWRLAALPVGIRQLRDNFKAITVTATLVISGPLLFSDSWPAGEKVGEEIQGFHFIAGNGHRS